MTTSAPAAVWRSVDPAAIEPALGELWLEAAQDGPVSRAVMSNLVVVRPNAAMKPDAQEEPDSDIVRIAQQHPARTILLNYSPGSNRLAGPARASIGVVRFSAGGAQYGVELIAVDAACSDRSIPSIVRGLVRGDLPTTLWWAGDLSHLAPTAGIVAATRQVIYDSAMWRDVAAGARATASMTSERRTLDLADLNWRRLGPLRSALVHALETRNGNRTLTAADVRIDHRPGDAAAAWLLAAWFACRLKWTGPTLPAIAESRDSDDFVTIVLWPGDAQLTAGISRQRVKVKAAGAPVFRMPVPHDTLVDAVVAELRSLGHDTCLTETVATLADLLRPPA
jgi:glucose-6-phosphate dehydrogenase assembly protein OpcA